MEVLHYNWSPLNARESFTGNALDGVELGGPSCGSCVRELFRMSPWPLGPNPQDDQNGLGRSPLRKKDKPQSHGDLEEEDDV